VLPGSPSGRTVKDFWIYGNQMSDVRYDFVMVEFEEASDSRYRIADV
jgi:hypothetical protein